MVGGNGPRNVQSRYQRPCDANAGEGSSDGRRQRGRSSGSRTGRPPLVRLHDVLKGERRTSDASEDKKVR
jgi:hypothetical protein